MTAFADEMPIPPEPWSPIPRMASPSETTIWFAGAGRISERQRHGAGVGRGGTHKLKRAPLNGEQKVLLHLVLHGRGEEEPLAPSEEVGKVGDGLGLGRRVDDGELEGAVRGVSGSAPRGSVKRTISSRCRVSRA